MPFALLFIIRCMLFTTLWLLWFARIDVRVGVKQAEAVHLARQAAELTEEFLEIQHSGAVGNQSVSQTFLVMSSNIYAEL